MKPEQYVEAFKNKFGEQMSKDGQLIRDMNDFEVLDRALRRYPGDKDKIDSVALDEYYKTYDPSKKLPPSPPKTEVQKKLDQLTGGIAERFKERQQQSMDIELSDQNLGSKILQQVGTGAGLVGDVGFEALKTATPEFIKEPIKGAIGAIAQTEPVQKGVEMYGQFKEENPELAGNLEAVGNIASVVPMVGVPAKGAQLAAKAGKEGVEAVVDVAKQGGKVAKETIETAFTPTEASVNKYITDSFNKSIKPSLAGKDTLAKSNRFQNQALDAVKTIADNKDNLKYITPDGDEIVGLPQNLRQFSESIDQTKKTIYDEYTNLAKQAGEAGAEINLGNTAKELDAVIENKALQISNPEAVEYAKKIKERLADGGSVDATTAEQIIKNYNSSLESFYRNPSYETASRAAIDASVVNNIRKDLDSVIESLTGEQYQALKNKYAALKAIEKDVVKRANVDARKNAQGLLDYTDIFSGGDIVGGILSLNPALFAKGVAQKSIKEWFKILNDPNRAVKKMFEKTQVETR